MSANRKSTKNKKNEKETATECFLNYVSLKDYMKDPKQGYAGYHVAHSKIINILFVGRSQAGKSTLLATLLNPQQAVQGRGFSVTKEPQVQAFILNDEHTNNAYTINVIDTPGLREKRIDNLQSRGDEEIIRLARHCISNQITYLNIVIYVTVAKRTHELDAEAFESINKFLGDDFDTSSLLVLSHCEEIPPQRFEQIIDDMETFPETKKIIEYCKLGVLPYGTMNADQLLLADDDDDEEETPEEKEENKRKKIHKTIKRIEKMRQDLFQVIIKTADKPRAISQLQGQLQYIKEQQEKAIETALGAEKENFNKVLEEKKKQFEEQLTALQTELEKRYQAESVKDRELQNKKFQEEMKKQIDEQKKEYEKKMQDDQRKHREEFEKQLTALSEEQRREKARVYAEQQAKQARERERQMEIELEQKRRERERLYYEQQQREIEERNKRLAAEREAERLRLSAEYENKLRAQSEKNDSSCCVM